MIINSNPSDFTEDSSSFSENESILSGFTDENLCGEGATCRVYHIKLQGLHVALKRLRDEYLGEPIHEAAFRKEFKIGQQLKHDALPVYREMRADDMEVYIVMDFIDGISVDDFLKKEEGRRYFQSADNVRRFLSELIGVVGYLHRKGIIHCDIKPANIMLRHSDRGVMLIDLDKAYSDTLDTTSGGSSNFSSPVKYGKKPTAWKDFEAIGKILDFIAEKTPSFPNRRFKRFRAECDNPTTTPEELIAALRRKSRTGLWIGVLLSGITIVCGIVYYYYSNTSESALREVPEVETYEESADTVSSHENNSVSPQRIPETQPSQPESRQLQISVAEFDNRMNDFTQEAHKGLSMLSSEPLSDRQITDLMHNIILSHSSKYQAVLSAYKAENPEISGIDVELAMARTFEKSKAKILLEQITQAVRDTIVARHPESHTDNL